MFNKLNSELKKKDLLNVSVKESDISAIETELLFNNLLEEINEIIGGKADGMTEEDIAKMEEEGKAALAEEDLYVYNEFNEFLSKEKISIREDSLNEGKASNWIRWKLAKFSLRFLSDKSLEELLAAYYSDENGNPTEKSDNVKLMSRKEKLNKVRELAEKINQDEKQKIVDLDIAKKLEREALGNIAVAGALGVTAALVNMPQDALKSTSADLEELKDSRGLIAGKKGREYFGNTFDKESQTLVNKTYDTYLDNRGYENIRVKDGLDPNDMETFTNLTNDRNFDSSKSLGPVTDILGSLKQSTAAQALLSRTSLMLSILASTMFGIMWGSIIMAGVSSVQGLRKITKAQTLRRDEIINQIINKKNISEALAMPKKGEKQDDFISRFMGDEQSKKDFPENKQRVAVAFTQWRRKHGKSLKEGVIYEFPKIMFGNNEPAKTMKPKITNSDRNKNSQLKQSTDVEPVIVESSLRVRK